MKDVRYQLKTLESASVMDTEDFFAGDFSKSIKPSMLVKQNSSASATPKSTNPHHTEEDTEMTEDENQAHDFGPKTFFTTMTCPAYNINYILDSDKVNNQNSGRRLKRTKGLSGQLRHFLT